MSDKKSTIAASLGALALLLGSTAANSATLSLVPDTSSGTSFTVTLHGTEFTDGLTGGGVFISWDDSILSLDGWTVVFPSPPGPLLFAPITSDTDINSVDDTFNFDFANFCFSGCVEPVATSFDAVHLNFSAVGVGTTDVALTLQDNNPFADWEASGAGNPIIFNAGDITGTTLTAVPLPPAFLLLASGFAAMSLVGRRRSRS